MSTNLIHSTPSAYQYPLLIKHLLHAPLARSPEQEIVYRDLRRHTYRTFRERLGRLASGLTQLGVKKGDVVAVIDWDSHRYHDCYFAIPMMGAVLQTVNISLAPEQLVYTLNDAEATTILFNLDFLPLLDKICAKLKTVKRYVVMRDSGELPATRLPVACEYEELLAGGSPYFQFPDFDENTRATIFHTTGTTGMPKGVAFSHRQLVLHTIAALAAYGTAPNQGHYHRDDVYMPMTPMFHVHAWGCPYTATTTGSKLVFAGRYSPEIFLRLIKDEGVTFTHCVPTILQMLLTAPGSKDVDLSKLKMVIGGSALPRSLARAARQRGIDIFSGYGLSEACPFLTSALINTNRLTGDEQELDYRTRSGMPGPLVELRVVDPNMEDVSRDGKTPGEIVARAPWLTMSYLNNPEASEQLWAGGYMHTGDVGMIDSEGFVHVTDRLKDVIKSGGEWISSIELEDIISERQGVVRVAVIGVPDEKWGERPLALVILEPGFVGKIGAEDIRRHVASYVDKGVIPRLAIPDRISFVNDLPLTSIGKIDKKKLRASYQQQAAA